MHTRPEILLLTAGLGLWVGCTPAPPEVAEKTFFINETEGRIAVPFSDAAQINTLEFQTRQKIEPLLELFDASDQNSEISTINRVTGFARVPVSRDTMRLLKHAVLFGEISQGAFDITTSPLSALWGFNEGTPPGKPLARSVRDAALQSSGYDKIDLDDHSVYLTTPYTKIDVNCLSSSYALDIAVLSHRSAGVPSLFLNYGSDFRVLGRPSPESPWTQPLAIPQTGKIIGTIEFGLLPAVHVEESSPEFVEIGGRKFYNNIHPKTGNAVNGNRLAVVAAKSATKAAALAYALIRHEIPKAQDLVDAFGECTALIIPNREPMEIWLSADADKTFRIDPAFSDRIQRAHFIDQPQPDTEK